MAPEMKDHWSPRRRGEGRLHESPTRRHVDRETEGDVPGVTARELHGAPQRRSGMTASVGHGLFSRLLPGGPSTWPFPFMWRPPGGMGHSGLALTTPEPHGTF